MKVIVSVLCLLAVCGCMKAHANVWQPPVGYTQIPIWPGTPPDAQPVPGPETVWMSKGVIAGRPVTGVTNVTRPTMTVYAAKGKSTGAAVVVIPGAGSRCLPSISKAPKPATG